MFNPDTFAEPRKARIEIIPLIDVIFFLLATFVLFTLSLQKIQVFDPDLPHGVAERGEPDPSLLQLQASAAGTYYWKRGSDTDAQIVLAPELRDRLLHYRTETGTPRVIIRGDSTATLGDAVHALDEVRRAGITAVAVETLPSKTGK